jgi:hypothetical protein
MLSPSEIATIIIMLCGAGESEAHSVCYDYYVNCIVDNGQNLKAVEVCNKNRDNGIKRINKLQKEGDFNGQLKQ